MIEEKQVLLVKTMREVIRTFYVDGTYKKQYIGNRGVSSIDRDKIPEMLTWKIVRGVFWFRRPEEEEWQRWNNEDQASIDMIRELEMEMAIRDVLENDS